VRNALAGFLLVVGVSACSGTEGSDEENCAAVLCAPCQPALTLNVQTPTQQPVPDLTLSGVQGSCSVDGNATLCSIDRDGPGTLVFQVSAPGFQTQSVHRDIKAGSSHGCCQCSVMSQVDTLTLQPS
jgi:hypothetical protein